MNKVKMTTWSQLIFMLKNNNVDIKDYDYIEGRTTEEYMKTHPYIRYSRRFYDNPSLWILMLEKKLDECIKFILNLNEYYPDISICRACIHAKVKTTKWIESILTDMLAKCLLEEGIKVASINLNYMLEDICEVGNLEMYKHIIDFAQKSGIPPLFGEYANASDGNAFVNAINSDNDKLVEYMLDNQVDAGLRDSLCYCISCKKGKYDLAVRMLDRGSDPHAKKDLALKMIERNDKMKKTTKEDEARKVLMSNYK